MRQSAIFQGMTRVFHENALSNHIENHGCGREAHGLDSLEPSDSAWLWAARVIGRIEERCDENIHTLLWSAAEADGKPWEYPGDEYATEFGRCLAHMAVGAGISWDDDHAQLEVLEKMASLASGGEIDVDLELEIEKHCMIAKAYCPECEHLLRIDRLARCTECGKATGL